MVTTAMAAETNLMERVYMMPLQTLAPSVAALGVMMEVIVVRLPA
jgi:hypothetical protein